jgi:hypothetical protein
MQVLSGFQEDVKYNKTALKRKPYLYVIHNFGII